MKLVKEPVAPASMQYTADNDCRTSLSRICCIPGHLDGPFLRNLVLEVNMQSRLNVFLEH